MNKMQITALGLCACLLLAGCNSFKNMNNTAKGGIIGGGSGATAGAIIGGLIGKGKGAGIGAAIAIVLTLFKVPALPFALGMFIPIELNIPLMIGGAVAWYVGSRSKDKAVNEARKEKGTLVASGFIAGGALMGVVSAIMRFADVNLVNREWQSSTPAVWIALGAYILLIGYMIWACRKTDSADNK